MSGILYVCATPIGNLGDVTERLRATLAEVDVVFAEDTRRTGKLLARLELGVPLRSFFVGNETERVAELADRLAAGERVALLSDAGTPSVADPGLSAVRAAVSVGAVVTPIPGPSVVTAALSIADVPTERFVFEGFLPRKGKERSVRLADIAAERRTVVFFTTGQRIAQDLEALAALTGRERRLVVARELTKLHEEVWRGTIGEAVDHWREGRGEFTIVFEGGPAPPPIPLDEAVELVGQLVASGASTKDAIRSVVESTGVRKRELYDRVIRSGR